MSRIHEKDEKSNCKSSLDMLSELVLTPYEAKELEAENHECIETRFLIGWKNCKPITPKLTTIGGDLKFQITEVPPELKKYFRPSYRKPFGGKVTVSIDDRVEGILRKEIAKNYPTNTFGKLSKEIEAAVLGKLAMEGSLTREDFESFYERRKEFPEDMVRHVCRCFVDGGVIDREYLIEKMDREYRGSE